MLFMLSPVQSILFKWGIFLTIEVSFDSTCA